eukprot:397433-Alexandrium_andersonii.AAC.1
MQGGNAAHVSQGQVRLRSESVRVGAKCHDRMLQVHAGTRTWVGMSACMKRPTEAKHSHVHTHLWSQEHETASRRALAGMCDLAYV